MLPPSLVVGRPGGPAGPFWSLVRASGEVVAMQIPTESNARLFAEADRMFAALVAISIPAGDTLEELQELARQAIAPLMDRIRQRTLEGIEALRRGERE